jgi:hypothetical protein
MRFYEASLFTYETKYRLASSRYSKRLTEIAGEILRLSDV